MKSFQPRIIISRVGESSSDFMDTKVDKPESAVAYWNDVVRLQADYEPDKELLVVILPHMLSG